ncbi:MAG TPA: hypothetical protein GXZ64_01450, partial [Clostridiaceae bacterium]|nr:hypothetical protein [Clostridiaceae bacterium]
SPRNLESWAKLALYQPFLGAAELAIVAVAREDEILAKAIRGMLKIYSWKDIVKT